MFSRQYIVIGGKQRTPGKANLGYRTGKFSFTVGLFGGLPNSDVLKDVK